MKINLPSGMRKLNAGNDTHIHHPKPLDLDLREEYANAFRTESYNQFWTRVIALNKRDTTTSKSVGSTTAARLSSYRLFVENLLDPDQPTVTRILALTPFTRPENHTLFVDYFSQTADASILCGLLLKDVDNTRIKYKSLKATLDMLQNPQFSKVNHLPIVSTRLTDFSKSFNPFASSASYPTRFQAVQSSCSELLKRLEARRGKAQSKLKLINKLKRSSAIVIVALTVSLTAIVAVHALAILVAAPGVIAISVELASSKKLVKLSAQLDTAAKGTYILIRDLDTISRLVARLNDELEYMHGIIMFWLGRGVDRLQASAEVARRLKMNDTSFSEQLDELEEHLYLCFMTINRARTLVIKEILDPDCPT